MPSFEIQRWSALWPSAVSATTSSLTASQGIAAVPAGIATQSAPQTNTVTDAMTFLSTAFAVDVATIVINFSMPDDARHVAKTNAASPAGHYTTVASHAQRAVFFVELSSATGTALLATPFRP